MKQIFLLVLVCCSCVACAQDYRGEFRKLMTHDQEDAVPALLAEWERNRPDDAEMFIAHFNYYYNQSRNEFLRISREPVQREHLAFTDSTGQTAGYLMGDVAYNDSLFSVPRQYITKGIAKHPNRLDMHFGLLYALREAGYLKDHADELVRVIGYHAVEKRPWKWSDETDIPDVDAVFTGSVQDYVAALFQLGAGPYTEGIRAISTRMIEAYPNAIENYSNLGVYSLLEKDYAEALKWFQKARAINEKDAVVLGNIAYTYSLTGDTRQAIRYYKEMAKYGDKDTAAEAKERIKELEE